MEKAKVGTGSDPETQEIQKYDLSSLTLWDSPGLGDSESNDKRHGEKISRKLNEKDDKGNGLIDLVMVIIDSTHRDLGSAYKVMKDYIIPNIDSTRIILGLNKADTTDGKSMYWDYQHGIPTEKMKTIIEGKKNSIRRRIKDETSIDIVPVAYSAGLSDEDIRATPWNLLALLNEVYFKTPQNKRLIIADTVNKNRNNYKNTEDKKAGDDIKTEFKKQYKGIFEKACESVGETLFGETGRKVGKVVGSCIDWVCDKLWPF